MKGVKKAPRPVKKTKKPIGAKFENHLLRYYFIVLLF